MQGTKQDILLEYLEGIKSAAQLAFPHNKSDWLLQLGLSIAPGLYRFFTGKGGVMDAIWPFLLIFGALYLIRFLWTLLKRPKLNFLERLFIMVLFVSISIGVWFFGHSRPLGGEYMGEYSIKFGRGVTIATDEFRITFMNETYLKNRNGDSELVFPKFRFGTENDYYKGDEQPYFRIGQPFSLSSKNYYYTAYLKNLNKSNKDTSATFDVYKEILHKSNVETKP